MDKKYWEVFLKLFTSTVTGGWNYIKKEYRFKSLKSTAIIVNNLLEYHGDDYWY